MEGECPPGWSPAMMSPGRPNVTEIRASGGARLGFRCLIIETAGGEIVAEARGNTASECEARARMISEAVNEQGFAAMAAKE